MRARDRRVADARALAHGRRRRAASSLVDGRAARRSASPCCTAPARSSPMQDEHGQLRTTSPVSSTGVGRRASSRSRSRAKMDAERWRKLGVADHVDHDRLAAARHRAAVHESIAPRINGSRRFLFGSSLQPSEFGKLAVVVWTSMLLVKKGDQLRAADEGPAAVSSSSSACSTCSSSLEPDLSVAMHVHAAHGDLLFAGGVRIGALRGARHARHPGALARDRAAAVRAAAHDVVPRSGRGARAGELPAQAVAHRGRVGRTASASGSARDGSSSASCRSAYNDFIAQQHRRGVGVPRARRCSRSRSPRTRCSASASRARRARRSCSSSPSG